jgi:hypothetical protein
MRVPTLRPTDPQPFGEVTLAPALATGRTEAELARAMAEALIEKAPESGAEALKYLRQSFPDSPLAARVAALSALMRR